MHFEHEAGAVVIVGIQPDAASKMLLDGVADDDAHGRLAHLFGSGIFYFDCKVTDLY